MILRKITFPLLTVILLIVALPLFSVPRVAGLSFNSPQALEQTPGTSNYPSSLQASDGKLWVAWQQYYDTGVYMTYTSSQGWSQIQSLPTGYAFSVSPSLGQMRNSSIILLWSSNQTGHWNLYYKLYSNGAWRSTVVRLTTGTSFDDFFPKVAVSNNSTVYLFWERYFSSTSASIYYKTLKGNIWSGDIQLSSGNVDVTPTALGAYGGKIWVAWSRQVSTNYQVYYRNYDGVAWSAETLLTNNNYDIGPGLVQDRNGTIWMFWSRQIQLSQGSGAVYEQKLFYKYTYTGTSWSADIQLTSYGDVNLPLDDLQPSVVMGFDKSLWIFYSTDYPFASEYDIYYIKSSMLFPVHNIVISQIQAGPYAFQKSSATVLVTVTNLGDYSETIQLTVTATNGTTYTIANAVSETITLGTSQTFSFAWNTATTPLLKYTITASYPAPTGQSVLSSAGDTLRYKSLTILPPIKKGGCHNLRDCPS